MYRKYVLPPPSIATAPLRSRYNHADQYYFLILLRSQPNTHGSHPLTPPATTRVLPLLPPFGAPCVSSPSFSIPAPARRRCPVSRSFLLSLDLQVPHLVSSIPSRACGVDIMMHERVAELLLLLPMLVP